MSTFPAPTSPPPRGELPPPAVRVSPGEPSLDPRVPLAAPGPLVPPPSPADMSTPVVGAPVLPAVPAHEEPFVPVLPAASPPGVSRSATAARPGSLPSVNEALTQVARPPRPPRWHRWVRLSIVVAFLLGLPAVAYFYPLASARSGDQTEPESIQTEAAPQDASVGQPPVGPDELIIMTPTGEDVEIQPGDGWEIPVGTFPEPEPVETDEFGEVDFEAAARASIGVELYEDIKSRTSLTIVHGDTGPYAARASYEWTNDGSPGVAVITVSQTGYRDQFHDLIAHELAHVAVYSMGLIDAPEQECLADVIASHWRGYGVTNGDYDYVTCEWNETAQLVIDEFNRL